MFERSRTTDLIQNLPRSGSSTLHAGKTAETVIKRHDTKFHIGLNSRTYQPEGELNRDIVYKESLKRIVRNHNFI